MMDRPNLFVWWGMWIIIIRVVWAVYHTCYMRGTTCLLCTPSSFKAGLLRAYGSNLVTGGKDEKEAGRAGSVILIVIILHTDICLYIIYIVIFVDITYHNMST
jgi:hypothetical protein